MTFDNYDLIKSFSPFGENWPSPNFELRRIFTSSLTYSRNLEHILTYIGQGIKLVGFNFPKSEMMKYSYVDMTGRMKTSSYRGLLSLEFDIKSISESKK